MKYNKENKDKRNEYCRKRYQSDPQFRLIANLRRRLNHALNGEAKLASTLDLLGCTIEKCKNHLESQFKPGMSWENHGKWEIDHIRPCALYDLTNLKEQKECFSWKNLQPLWAEENLRKGISYE